MAKHTNHMNRSIECPSGSITTNSYKIIMNATIEDNKLSNWKLTYLLIWLMKNTDRFIWSIWRKVQLLNVKDNKLQLVIYLMKLIGHQLLLLILKIKDNVDLVGLFLLLVHCKVYTIKTIKNYLISHNNN